MSHKENISMGNQLSLRAKRISDLPVYSYPEKFAVSSVVERKTKTNTLISPKLIWGHPILTPYGPCTYSRFLICEQYLSLLLKLVQLTQNSSTSPHSLIYSRALITFVYQGIKARIVGGNKIKLVYYKFSGLRGVTLNAKIIYKLQKKTARIVFKKSTREDCRQY